MTAALQACGLTKRYSDATAVEAVDLDLAPGSFTALLGPSGCGKSTTLQMIAGLVTPDAGRVTVDGRDMSAVRTEHRPISLVFQKPLLFPHLSVTQNVGFGLRMQHASRQVVADRVAAMLERVQLDGLGHRRPHELSGGQEQRVALARALVLEPSVLLLDEPFSQLDASLRLEMRHLVRGLHDSTGVTTVFVTHDQAEAVEISDEIVLMLSGRIEARGTPERLYVTPPTLATARFFGVTNELAGEAVDGAFRLGDRNLAVDTGSARGQAVLTIRPEAIELRPVAAADTIGLTLESVRFAGAFMVMTGRTIDDQILTLHAPIGTSAGVGATLQVGLPPDRCTVFPGSPA